MRINATLQVSRLQKWSEVVALLLVSLVLIFSEIPAWGNGLALLFMSAFVAYQRLIAKPTARLVQLVQFDKTTWRWSVEAWKRIQKTTKIEGRLVSIRGGLFVLVLRLESIENNKWVSKDWVIWRDQVDADNWRRLIVMARFWTDDVVKVEG